MEKIIAREVAIMDAPSGSVSLHTLPQSVRTEEDLEDYLHLTLEIDSNNDWIAAEHIVLSDFRIKPPRIDGAKDENARQCGNCGRAATHSAGGVNRCDRCNE